jgi:hypothetical protein
MKPHEALALPMISILAKTAPRLYPRRRGIGGWMAFYNDERPQQALSYRTPGEVFEAATCVYVDNASASLRSRVVHIYTGTTARRKDID